LELEVELSEPAGNDDVDLELICFRKLSLPPRFLSAGTAMLKVKQNLEKV
jgi:hypothetical protein